MTRSALLPTTASNTIVEFIGWVPAGQELVEANVLPADYFTTVRVSGDADFIAFTKGARKTPYVAAYRDVTYDGDTPTYTPVGTSMTATANRVQLTAEVQDAIGIEIRYGDTLYIMEQSAIDALTAEQREGNVYVSVEQIDWILRHARNVTPSLADIYADYTFGYTPTGNVFTAANSNNYEPKAKYIDSSLAEPFSTSLTLGSTASPVLYIAYQGAVVTDTYNAVATNGTAGTWDNGTYSSNVSVDGAVLSITGRYMDTYDLEAEINAHLVAPFGYSHNSWSTATTAGSYRGANHNATYTAASVSAYFFTEEGMTQVATGSANYNANLSLTAANNAIASYPKSGSQAGSRQPTSTTFTFPSPAETPFRARTTTLTQPRTIPKTP